MRKKKKQRGSYNMTIYFTYKNYERLFRWLLENFEMCRKVTGVNPIKYINDPLGDRDLGSLPFISATFPPHVQWWINKHCPYEFVKSRGRAKGKTIVLDWYHYKLKKS